MKPYSQQVLDFFDAHRQANLEQLALKKSPFSEYETKTLIQQLLGIQVAKKKFPTFLEYPQLRFPKKISLEQSSSEAVAKYKSTLIQGDRFADLTGGFGVDTYWLGKTFKVINYVEPNPALQILAQHNFKTLGLRSVNFHEEKAEDFLAKCKDQLDWIYLDPSRRVGTTRKIGLQGYQPNIYELESQLLARAKQVLIKVSPMQDLSAIIQQLSSVQKLIVCEWDKEVKEVLILLNHSAPEKSEVLLEIVQIESNATFEAKFEQIRTASNIGAIDQFIFEPGPGLQKSGLNNFFGRQFDLTKIHAHSQLFSTTKLFTHPLGRSYEVIEKLPLNKKKLLPFLPHKKANVIVRNFPMKAPAIKKKLGIKEGGDIFLIATTNHKDKPIVLLCKRVLGVPVSSVPV